MLDASDFLSLTAIEMKWKHIFNYDFLTVGYLFEGLVNSASL